jgi:hypothetical protein
MPTLLSSWRRAALLSLTFLLPAFAAEAADRRVIVDDPRIVESLRGAVGQAETSEEIARNVGILMYEDNQLSWNESDLFVELMDNVQGNIEITPPDGEPFLIPEVVPAGRDFLSLSGIPDLNALWLQGPVEMRKLVDVTVLNPHVRDQIQHYIANQLYLRWQTSNFVNNYNPLRTTLSTAYAQWRDAGPETLQLARGILYDALVELDQAVRDEVPNELYDHLRS